MKNLLLVLLTLLVSGSLWAEDDFKTLNQTLNQLESEPDYEGKRLDIQYFLTKKCAGAFEVLVEVGDEWMEETAARMTKASIGFRMMIGGNKPGGLDKSRDEISLEVNDDIKKNKNAYIAHLTEWYESPEKKPEDIFSEPFQDDLRICMSIADSFRKD